MQTLPPPKQVDRVDRPPSEILIFGSKKIQTPKKPVKISKTSLCGVEQTLDDFGGSRAKFLFSASKLSANRIGQLKNPVSC